MFEQSHSVGAGQALRGHDAYVGQQHYYGEAGYGEANSGASGASSKPHLIVNLAGALTSIALVIGVAVWSYNLVSRDVSGVPVVKALEGPIRIQPEKPGGTPAAHQGLAVNEIAALGSAPAAPDQLMLAPAPVAITADDVAGVLVATSNGAAANAAVIAAPETNHVTANSETGSSLSLSNVQQVSAVARNTPATKAVLDELVASIAANTPSLTPVTPAPKLAVVKGGIGTSLRPKARVIRGNVIQASAPANITLTGVEVDPASVPLGTPLVQLGAFDSAEVARGEWNRLAKTFDGYLATKKRVIERAEKNGKTFYRLRALGFDQLADAQRFCYALEAENARCLSIVKR